ncbi:hypothetical protein BJF88_14120 [Cellulosimicrobium sp. CUA-896]|nr:hypothetical protein BJF88_14120 [Cellulosimicrobium sp. CUA-896]
MVERLARGVGSYFCGSFAPEPMTWWVWWLVRMTTLVTLAGSASHGCSSCSARARSMSACDWYSAECSLVYVSRIAVRGSPGAGSTTSYAASGPSSSHATTPSSPS